MDELLQRIIAQSPIAAAIAIPLFYFLRWLMTQIIEPMYRRHILHIDKAEEQMEKQTECLTGVKSCMDRMQANQEEHMDICRGRKQT